MNMDRCALNGCFAPAQKEKWLNAVAHRRSVRAYADAPDVEQMGALHYAAARLRLPGMRIVIAEAPSALLFRKLPFVEQISGTNRYAAIVANEKEDPRAALYAGAGGEAFVLEAASLGVGSCWVMSFRRSGVSDLSLEAGEKVLAVTPLGIPAERTGTGAKRKKLNEICLGDPTHWPIWAYNAAECVRRAPSAMNRQPWRISFAGRTLILSRSSLGSPLDYGIAALHLSLGVGNMAHTLRWGEGREIISLVAEDQA